MKLKFVTGFLMISLLTGFFASCRRSNVVALVDENVLFTMDYGNFEDELNLFTLSRAGSINTFMTMVDGFFYIVNGESKKIMALNSYGDLLSLYYNPEFSKAPSFAGNSGTESTKIAVEYPFNSLGPVSVDSRKYLYAVDSLPAERQEYDEANRLRLSNVVLRFRSDGSFIDYIGQQGPGGTPFPHIKDIFTTKNNEFVVVCNTNEGFVVYWFNESGFLLYTVPVTEKYVPVPDAMQDEETSVYVSVGKIVPDNVYRRLYLKADYFKTLLDEDTKVQSGINYDRTLLYTLDVETGLYDTPLDIPPYEEFVSGTLSKDMYEIPFDFLGVTDSGWFFFTVPIESGYLIQMVQPNGQRILKRALPVNHNEILYYSLDLNGSGIISALFAKREHAEICWWRTDSLIDGLIN